MDDALAVQKTEALNELPEDVLRFCLGQLRASALIPSHQGVEEVASIHALENEEKPLALDDCVYESHQVRVLRHPL
jgi:hypothetical protein